MAKLSRKSIKTTADLREMLIDTIADVRSGKLDHKAARTVAALSTTILHSAKLDLDVLRFNAKTEKLGEPKRNVLSLVG